MRQKDFELKILVGGKPIHEYEHQNNFFVEGRKGSEFELEFKNNTSRRILAVPSVDGLSVMDGKPATADSMGYVVPAHGILRVPGWRLDAKGAAKFIFEDKDRSYARTVNTDNSVRAGVVGILVFEEKVPVHTISTTIYAPPPYIGSPCYSFVPTWQPYWNNPTAVPKNPFDVRYSCGGISNTMGVVSNSATAESCNAANSVLGGTVTASNMAAVTPTSEVTKAATRRVQLKESDSPFEMGTGFGQKTEFNTNETQFDKGDQTATLVIYYDSRRNLEKRGIQVVRTQRTYLEDLPSPFTSSGCTPPPGWNG